MKVVSNCLVQEFRTEIDKNNNVCEIKQESCLKENEIANMLWHEVHVEKKTSCTKESVTRKQLTLR